MPLVRIDIRKGKDADDRLAIGRAVYDALVSVGVPENDRFQVVGEHAAENFALAAVPLAPTLRRGKLKVRGAKPAAH